MLVFVTATRDSRSDFDRRSPLARSLPRMGQLTPLGLKLHADNRRPLADCYNEAIDEAADDDLLVFVHDDVSIDDWMAGAQIPGHLRGQPARG